MNTPKVTFIYAYPLDQERRERFAKMGSPYPAVQEVLQKTQEWESAWELFEQEHHAIELIANLTHRTPHRSLECFLYGAGLGATSAPLLIPTHKNDASEVSNDLFIQILIHELLHIFTTTDTTGYWNEVAVRYAGEDEACKHHIIIYACMEKITQKFFNADPIDYSRTVLPVGYKRAIAIVRERGADSIINEYNSLVN